MTKQKVETAAPTWLPEVVCCPRCRTRLKEQWVCTTCGPFRTAPTGAPVLIDFNNSVIEEDAAHRMSNTPGLLNRIAAPLLGLTNGSGGVTAMAKAGELLSGVRSARVLIVGGGGRWEGLDRFVAAAPSVEILNTDIYPGPFVHVLSDAHQLAFADESFDMVITQAVLEHVIDPPVAVQEFWRVLKPDGLVLADTPFMQPVHAGAYDFTRFTPLGQRALFKRFTQLATGVSAGPMSALRWSIEHAFRSLFRSRYPAILVRPLTAPFGWFDQFSSRFALDGCCGSYFIGRKSQTTATPKEIIAAYHGAQ